MVNSESDITSLDWQISIFNTKKPICNKCYVSSKIRRKKLLAGRKFDIKAPATTKTIFCYNKLSTIDINMVSEIFDPNPNRQPSFLSNKWTQISSALFGFGFVCFYNFFTKRPALSGEFLIKLYNIPEAWLSFVCFDFDPDDLQFNNFLILGIQKHLIATSLGAIGGQFIEDRRLNYLAERDAVLRNYIELHPDDFPQPERKKYADVVEPWIPVR